MIVCLIGGGNMNTGELNDTIKVIKQLLTNDCHILTIPFAAPKEKWSSWQETVHSFFHEVDNASITMLDDELSANEMIQLIHKSNVLFFTGGKPDQFMRILVEKELMETMKAFTGLIIGYSAGALICSKNCIITKDKDYSKTEIIEGLGLIDFSIEVHYDPTIDEELFPLSMKNKIIAIPNGSSIFVQEDCLQTINTTYIISNNNKDVFS